MRSRFEWEWEERIAEIGLGRGEEKEQAQSFVHSAIISLSIHEPLRSYRAGSLQ